MLARQRFLFRTGLLGGAIVLGYWWWRAILHVQAGDLFAHNNYWGAPVGTITLIIILVVLTPAYVWALIKFWNWQGYKPDKTSSG